MRRILLTGIVCALTLAGTAAMAAERALDAQELRGRALYYTALSRSGAPMSTYLGRSDMNVQGRGAVCVTCHGDTGQGESETGVAAGNITWDALSRPLAPQRGSVRQRPAYTPQLLKRLLLEGIDPAGRQIDATMPTYALSEKELDDLVAFLKVIGVKPDPGVSDSLIRIGTVLPRKGAHAATGRIIESTLRAAFDDLNRQGGIYARRLELIVADAGELPADARSSLQQLIEKENVFALLSPYLPTNQDALIDADLKGAIPVVGPFNAAPSGYADRMRYTFRTLAGAGEQANALLEYARLREPAAAASLVIVSDETQGAAELAQTAARFARLRLTERPVVQLPSEKGGMQQFAAKQKSGFQAVLYLAAPRKLGAFLDASAAANWYPFVYVPGQLAAREVAAAPAGFDGRVFVAYPTMPSDIQPAGATELMKLAEQSGMTPGSVVQVSALASFRILHEGLRQSGRDVTRERLISRLESMNKFDTALTPLVSFSPGRRVGANGAYIVQVDVGKKTLRQSGEWISLP